MTTGAPIPAGATHSFDTGIDSERHERGVRSGRRPPRIFIRAVLLILIAAGLYGILRLKRDELVDFAVPYRAAGRFLAHEPLYRPSDGHYQYKYLPLFAQVMGPFTLLPIRAAEVAWFTLTVAMAWGLVRLAVAALPDRRLSLRVLFWLVLLLNGKFLVKELGFGQFNLPVALLLLGAVIAARSGRGLVAATAIAAAVFVKPYALVLLPWLAWTVGCQSLVVFSLAVGVGLLLPAATYGWNGNLTLHVVEDDPRVPSPQSIELHMALKQLGVPTELYMYPGNTHGLPDPRNQLVKSVSELAWMDYYVRGMGNKFAWRDVLKTLEAAAAKPTTTTAQRQ